MKNVIACVLLSAVLNGVSASAQAPQKAPPPVGGGVEVDPINCWWRTDKTAVEVGERFTLTLTCSVVETNSNKVAVDPNQLDPSALSLAPFDIVGGTRHEDVLALPWRYFQYEYTVRIVGTTFFGLDVDIPALNLKYNILSKAGDSQGRDQMYILPALPMRVLSLVPSKTEDIRDVSSESFGSMEARRRRGTEELVAAAVALAFAIVLLGLALGRLVGRYRKKGPVASRALPPSTILAACLGAIRRLQSEIAGEGWTPDRAAHACAVFRIAAAVALGRTVAQSPAGRDAAVREGQVPVRTGIVRPRRALISAATSPETFKRKPASPAIGRRQGALAVILEEIHQGLSVFSATRYSRGATLDTAALDTALDNGASAIRRLRRMTLGRKHPTVPLAKAAAAAVAGAVWLR
jgi:hypothetical protein